MELTNSKALLALFQIFNICMFAVLAVFSIWSVTKHNNHDLVSYHVSTEMRNFSSLSIGFHAEADQIITNCSNTVSLYVVSCKVIVVNVA
jgi:hypothetical protein